MSMPRSFDRILITEDAIQERVQVLAQQISEDYQGKEANLDIVLIGVLKGCFMFLADISRRLTVAHQVDFVALSSYGAAGSKSGAVRFLMDTRVDLAERHVIIVEDILDTGYTLDYLVRIFKARQPASLKTCVLLRKPDRQQVELEIDYLGFDIPNVWVVGYGLDYADRFRTMPYIAALKPEVYEG